jgi:hypothetical protein
MKTKFQVLNVTRGQCLEFLTERHGRDIALRVYHEELADLSANGRYWFIKNSYKIDPMKWEYESQY